MNGGGHKKNTARWSETGKDSGDVEEDASWTVERMLGHVRQTGGAGKEVTK